MQNIHALAAKHLEEKNYEAALNIYEEALKENHEDPLIFANVANIVYMMRDLERAIPLFEKAIELDAACAVAYYGLGNIFYEQGDFVEAISSFEKAIRNGLAEDGDVHFLLGSSFVAMNQARLASMYLLRATELKPNDAEIWFMYGLCMGKCEAIDESVHALEKAVVLDPKHADAHYNLGVAYFMKENLEKAEKYLATALALQPEHLLARHAMRVLKGEV